MKKPSSTTRDSIYEVGYGKPPKANQFRKGRTGNPRGKRQGEENIISAFKRIVSKRVKINDGEKVRTITLAEAVIRKNYNAAVQKNPFAISNIYRLAEDAGELVDITDAKQVGSSIAVPEKVTIEEFMAEFGRKIGE
jgi:CxxC motif-containing protein